MWLFSASKVFNDPKNDEAHIKSCIPHAHKAIVKALAEVAYFC